ncbi:MAG TPA: hypothetical protein VKB34_17585 [Povalibacter sp.]|nr:hypothetical protein [Povalibacter sp.]
MDPLLVSLVSACTALVASVAGPIVTLSVARRQFSANVLSANRQKWIETLRDMLAELISLMVAVVVVKARRQGAWDRGQGAIAEDPKLLMKLERIVLVQWKIRLLLNPTEPDHQELYRAIEAAFIRIQSEESNDAATDADLQRMTELTQAILKREWQRVKRGV